MLFTFKRLLITPLVFSVIAMLSGRADAEVYKKLYNTDIVGADLSGADRRGVSEDQCATICNSMKSCTAYSWVVDTEWCWPKSNASRTKEAIGIFSGVISLRTNSQPPQIREVDTFVLPGKCLVVAASRATLDEARRFVVELDERLDNVRVFRSENGWYAVTVGIYDYNRGVNSASELISQGMIPTDAFCSSGKSYVEEFNLQTEFAYNENFKNLESKDIGFIEEVEESDLQSRIGFFRRAQGSAVGAVRLEANPLETRKGFCSVSVGRFSDGKNALEVELWRSYEAWGIAITTEMSIKPALVPPNPTDESTIPMNATFRRTELGYEASYVNANPDMMERRLGGKTALSLHVGKSGEMIRIEILELPQIMVAFQDCMVREEYEHRASFCAKIPPEHYDFHEKHLGVYCKGHWSRH